MIIKHNESKQRFEAVLDSGAAWHAGYKAVKDAGFRFDGNVNPKVWYTTDANVAAKLAEYADSSAAPKLTPEIIASVKQAETLKAESLETSRATDASVDIPRPQGLEYLPYQRAGVAYAMKRPNALIADEMGLGKTIQAIGIANADDSVRRVLIVCPASLKLNWQREWRKWDIKGLSVGIVAGRKGELPTDAVLIVNYDILEQRTAQFRAINFDLMIVDECHALKNLKTKRTQHLLGKRTWNKEMKAWDIEIEPLPAKRRVFLTGTPIVNRPAELWPLVLALDPNGLGKYKSKYEKRYCAAFMDEYGWNKSGASNLDELQTKMRSTFMVRRLKADVLKELPPKRRQVVVIEHDSDRYLEDLIAREKKAYAEFEKMGLTYESIPFESMSAVRAQVAVAKVPFVIEHLNATLEQVQKVVVMCHHHEVVDKLAAEFGDAAVTVDGRTPQADRQAAVDRFQTDPACRVFIGTIKAAGVGLTLTAASTIVFAELDWVPGNVTQAEDRCHRIGQTDNVLVQHLVLDESLDARMVEIIITKQAVIDKALDIMPVSEPKAMPPIGIEQPAPARPRQQNSPTVGPNFGTLTPEQVAAIHTGLRQLAAVCDGAFAEDSHGFNKTDANFGHSLANAPRLSERQALAGQKLIRKYQRQLSPELVRAAGVISKAELASKRIINGELQTLHA